jgi:hypothetical protein
MQVRYCPCMTSRSASTLPAWLLPAVLLMFGAGLTPAVPAAQPDAAGTTTRPVTATPPLQVVPATQVSKNVQQRMRGCNAAADARKLAAAGRETFIKSCMTPRRSRAVSNPGSQPKTHP